MADLLLELLSEEIPASMQLPAAQQLEQQMINAILNAGLLYQSIKSYVTPRRLTIEVRGLPMAKPAQIEERKGPNINAPTQAINGFLKSCNLTDISEAKVKTDKKGKSFYVAEIQKPQQSTAEILQIILPNLINNFSWPKSMRWGVNSLNPNALKWVRPLHSILCLLKSADNNEVVKFKVADIESSNFTYGHRFLSDNQPIIIKDIDSYPDELRKAYVILDREERKSIILHEAENLCFANNISLIKDMDLLEEVAGLVEYPVVLMGEFSSDFLSVPSEVIRLTIKNNQKCFVTTQNNSTDLSNKFILVSNIKAPDLGKEIIKGNCKVISSRLTDALYFWQTDQNNLPDLDLLQDAAQAFKLDLSKPLDQRMARLAQLNVCFHVKIGSQGERVLRIGKLAGKIAAILNIDQQKVARAASLLKADLQTEIVGEFPELQGLMGTKYALLQGEDPEVAYAIVEHYKPSGPKDSVPTNGVSISVGLADKLDLLASFWLINEKPTGSRDPYALRRAALGIIRLILANNYNLSIKELVKLAVGNVVDDLSGKLNNLEALDPSIIEADLLSFIFERFKVYLRDLGYRYDIIDAVLDIKTENLLQAKHFMDSLSHFLNSNDGDRFYLASKRVYNLLQAENTNSFNEVLPDLLLLEAEKNLYNTLQNVELSLSKVNYCDNSSLLLNIMGELTNPIEEFFATILVNDENEEIRKNRLSLLNEIKQLVSRFADFSLIVK